MTRDAGKLPGWDMTTVNTLAFALMTHCQMFWKK